MAIKRKQIGYYISKGKCLKAYNIYSKETNKYSKKRRTGNGRKLSKNVKIFKKKSDCLKKIKNLENKKSPKRKSPKRKTKFGSDDCGLNAPWFGNMIPQNPLVNWKWPSPGANALIKQQYRYNKP